MQNGLHQYALMHRTILASEYTSRQLIEAGEYSVRALHNVVVSVSGAYAAFIYRNVMPQKIVVEVNVADILTRFKKALVVLTTLDDNFTLIFCQLAPLY